MKIKICGLKEVSHAKLAAELSADFLGFVFAKSPRRISPDEARSVIKELPSHVRKVGVFVNEEIDTVNEISLHCGLDLVQLHGNETPDYCSRIKIRIIRGFRIKDRSSLRELEIYSGIVDIFLLDTYVQGITGGTGMTFDWQVAKEASVFGNILLAGGLEPDNVNQAINEAMPYGVDVSSGVETNGVKDPAKIEAFIRQVRGN
jgi:phosphoribosylanthranilate isomerase